MAEGKKITWKEFLLKGLYYDLIGSPEGSKLMRDFQAQRQQEKAEKQLEKLEKKLTKAKPEDKAKIEREILLVKAKYWWWKKSFKEQLAMEKEAKRLGIALDDYLIEEYKKAVKSQN